MKKEVWFTCEKCGCGFDAEDKCLEHEKIHQTPKITQSNMYMPNGEYPNMVCVEFDNGKRFLYEKRCEYKEEN